jgi:hypothetical protein
MLQVFQRYIAIVCSKCFICFHTYVAIVLIWMSHMLQLYVPNVSVASVLCCSKWFHVTSCKYFLCFMCFTHMLQEHVSSVFSLMLQVFYVVRPGAGKRGTRCIEDRRTGGARGRRTEVLGADKWGSCRSRALYGRARPQPLIPAPVCHPRDESKREKAVKRRTGKRRDKGVAHSWTERRRTGVGRRRTGGCTRVLPEIRALATPILVINKSISRFAGPSSILRRYS